MHRAMVYATKGRKQKKDDIKEVLNHIEICSHILLEETFIDLLFLVTRTEIRSCYKPTWYKLCDSYRGTD